MRGTIYFPNEGVVGKLPMINLQSLFEIGPDRRDIHDGFKLALSPTDYPAIWGHDSSQILSIKQESNQYLLPLTQPQEGRHLRDSTMLWKKSGRLLIAERMWLTTDRVFSIWCENKVLSNTWWTMKPNLGLTNKISSVNLEKVSSLWLNSTLGAIEFLRIRTETRGPWIAFKKPNLNSMRMLDVTALSENQIRDFVGVFDSINTSQLSSLPQMSTDKVRINIDSQISKILNIVDFSNLRDLLAKEPIFASQASRDMSDSAEDER